MLRRGPWQAMSSNRSWIPRLQDVFLLRLYPEPSHSKGLSPAGFISNIPLEFPPFFHSSSAVMLTVKGTMHNDETHRFCAQITPLPRHPYGNLAKLLSCQYRVVLSIKRDHRNKMLGRSLMYNGLQFLDWRYQHCNLAPVYCSITLLSRGQHTFSVKDQIVQRSSNNVVSFHFISL